MAEQSSHISSDIEKIRAAVSALCATEKAMVTAEKMAS